MLLECGKKSQWAYTRVSTCKQVRFHKERASANEDVNTTDRGGKPGLEAMECASSLVGGSLTEFIDEQN